MSVDHVRLRPAVEDDLPMLERFLADPEAAGPFGWFGWSDGGRFRRLWEENRLLGEDDGLLLLMVVRGDDRLGFVSRRKVMTGPGSFCWNIGIGMLPEARGHGHGAEAQRLLARYLFAHTQVARVDAVTEVGNVAERRALEKAGFTQEGVLRAYGFRDGRWRDAVLYSVIRDDLPPGEDTATGAE